MGTFNMLRIATDFRCPNCGNTGDRWLQFKYGELDQYSYEIGDLIAWRGDEYDEGSPGQGRVLVQAVAEPCPSCGYHTEADDYEIDIRGDVIVGAHISAYLVDFGMDGWVVIES